ncbi:ABC transporter substrate-binding protein [Faecalimonas umbilicata]|uniref:ABC transporter substrate-binding protein n=1 Tax=Faecalimonas umbilicata TaxID=1912855 RepID=UPI00055788E0|nr:ABC transporter substrate-binding protein [Faecalimonas umbilicata]MBS5762475.1 carbohydrate ABC transporter substrate-binding protein [Lachnospiraceae bacterium]RGC75207.1 carbohydrate ABC transporter substrate-binding protein [Coprococcus sp. AM25-15LB]RJW09089.1 carbohydrate ABC transporter substrate-binding protein [Coprococcus sp. AM25-4LB]MCI5987211.1 ABC transporter substrate-binding protein [Faecalimonas umbilicata]MDY2762056.1 ABC transporter substrate-binding protein [Faecalimonas
MMKKKVLAGLLACTMVFSMAACGGGDKKQESGANKEAKTEESKDSSGKTEITWWAFPTFTQENASDSAGTWEQKVIDAFEEKNPDISVNLEMIDFTSGPEKIIAAIEGGTICDVLFDAPGRIVEYGKNGKLVELNDMFTDEFVKDVNNETLLQSCKAGDTAYMYPISSAPFYMAFNKEMVKDAGVEDLIKEGWTTDDFTTVLKALKEKGYNPGSVFCSGQGGDQGTRAFVANLYDSAITDDDVTKYTINDEGGVKALEYIKKAVDDGLLMNGSAYNGGDDIQNFANGQTSFTLLWSPAQPDTQAKLLESSGVEYLEVPFPSEDGVPELEYLVNGFCVFDNGEEARVEASKKFIQFICDDEEWGPKNVVRTGSFPVRESFGDLYNNERMAELATWTKFYSPYYNTIDGFAEMRALWFPMLQGVMNGDQEPKAAADEFVEKADASIANAGK